MNNIGVNPIDVPLVLSKLNFSDQIKTAASLLGYKQLPVTIDQFISDPYYLGEICKNLYPFWKDKLRQIYPTEIHTRYPILVFKGGIGCVSGDTIIDTDIGHRSIKSLFENFDLDSYRVKTYDKDSNCYKYLHIDGIHYTGRKYVAKAIFISGKHSFELIATPNHRVLTKSGYKRLFDLKPEDEILGSKVWQLISLEDYGKVDTYDITVDKTHNYAVTYNNQTIVTHNTGKSTVARVMAMYLMHRLMCLRNIHDTFGLMPGKNMKFSFFSYTSGLAYTDFLAVINDWIDTSPYFHELADLGALAPIERVADGTRGNSNIGSDVIFYNLSEINFVNQEKAYYKLDQALKRFDSRFGRMSDYFGHIIVDTSSQGDDSIADEFAKDNPYGDKVLVVNTNQWKVREHLHYYGNKGWFKVYCGDSVHQPFIVSEDKPLTMAMDPDRVIDVPEEVRADFEFDLITALQDKAGISINSSDKFFPDTTHLMNCFKGAMYSPDVIKLNFYDKNDKLIYYLDAAIRQIPTDRIIYIHYDIGVTGDLTGLALSYFDRWQYFDRSDKNKFRLPRIVVPIAIGLSRFEGEETPIYQLEEFVMDLNQRFEIGCFSADQFASRQLLQDLKVEGIINKYISVDRSDEPYVFLKSLANHELLTLPVNSILKTELPDLRRVGGKIDHTSTNSKDIADAVCGSVYSCYLDIDKASQLSNKYKVTTYGKAMEERNNMGMDQFQDMLQGIYRT
jgi:hypothetical protein